MIELTAHRDRFAKGLKGIEQTERGTAIIQNNLSKESPKLIESQQKLESDLEEYSK